MLTAGLDTYGTSLHSSASGEWDFNLGLKPLPGFPVTVGWLNAVRRGHARIHRGIDADVPTLVLHSHQSHFSRARSEQTDTADVVLDVAQIARWAPFLGSQVTTLAITDAGHDVFLSTSTSRRAAYDALQSWLDQQH